MTAASWLFNKQFVHPSVKHYETVERWFLKKSFYLIIGFYIWMLNCLEHISNFLWIKCIAPLKIGVIVTPNKLML